MDQHKKMQVGFFLLKYKYVHDLANIGNFMASENNYITAEGFEALRQEYQQLFHKERPKLVETVAWAASNGDRSENADYIYGKRRLREIDSRLRFLTQRLEDAVVVDPKLTTKDRVVFGAWVEVEDEQQRKHRYRIVGQDESKPDENQLSWKSPLARALLGKVVDDEVVFQTPSGERRLLILTIA
jgi:transcription elongation factor GreB